MDGVAGHVRGTGFHLDSHGRGTYGTKPAHLIHDTAPHSMRAVVSNWSTEPCYFLATDLLQPEQIPQAFQALLNIGLK